MAGYNKSLDEMEILNYVAAFGFRGVDPKVFYKAFFKTHTKANVMVSNVAETFNGCIINARTLIYML